MTRALIIHVVADNPGIEVVDVESGTDHLSELLDGFPEVAGIGATWRMYVGYENAARGVTQNLTAWRLVRKLGWRGQDRLHGTVAIFGAARRGRRDIDIPDEVLQLAKDLKLPRRRPPKHARPGAEEARISGDA